MEQVLQQILAELKAQGRCLNRLEQGQEKIANDLAKLAAHVEGEITDKIRGLYLEKYRTVG